MTASIASLLSCVIDRLLLLSLLVVRFVFTLINEDYYILRLHTSFKFVSALLRKVLIPFLFTAFHTLTTLHFPLPHIQRPINSSACCHFSVQEHNHDNQHIMCSKHPAIGRYFYTEAHPTKVKAVDHRHTQVNMVILKILTNIHCVPKK